MYALLLLVHLIVCVALVGVVLIQSGKGGGLAGGAFGGSAQTVFGGRGATDFITRATMVLGAAFFITSLTLALMTTGTTRGGASRSLIQEEARRMGQQAPPRAPGAPSAVPNAAPNGQPATQPTGPQPPTQPPSGTNPAPVPPGGH